MGVSTEFESLEYQFLELISEFRLITASEARLREVVRTEASRAELAEAGLAAAERATAEARSGAAAATASATSAAAELATACDQLAGYKMQVELAERHRTILEEKCTELSGQVSALEREVQQLRPLQPAHVTLQRQYTELQERVLAATEEAKREASRLESELRRVERSVAGGTEIRERAKLAAAAHARERRLAAAELQHTMRELQAANAEISKLSSQVAKLQLRLAQENTTSKTQTIVDPDTESLAEVRSALEAERAGTEKLEKALAAALADNATLAAQIHAKDVSLSQVESVPPPPKPAVATNICPIDSFLAD